MEKEGKLCSGKKRDCILRGIPPWSPDNLGTVNFLKVKEYVCFRIYFGKHTPAVLGATLAV